MQRLFANGFDAIKDKDCVSSFRFWSSFCHVRWLKDCIGIYPSTSILGIALGIYIRDITIGQLQSVWFISSPFDPILSIARIAKIAVSIV